MRIIIKNNFTKEIGKALVKIREEKRLSKVEISNNTGFALKTLIHFEDATKATGLENYHRLFKSLDYRFEVRIVPSNYYEPDLVSVINELYWLDEKWTMKKVFKLYPELGGAGAEKAAQILNMAECIDVQIAEAIAWETRGINK